MAWAWLTLETMNSSYSILFSIELLHEYFLNRKSQHLEIIPAEDCQALFRKLGIQWRMAGHRLIAFIRENDVHEPFINNPPHKDYRKVFGKSVFRFYLKIKNPEFSSYTNTDYHSGEKYYFSNLAANKENGFLYLSTPVDAFASNREYVPGDLARDPQTGSVYEAIRKHSSKKKAELTDPDLWAPKGLSKLANVTDHAPGKTYLPGDLVRKPATDHLFEAIRKHSSVSKSQLNDPAFWIERGQGQLQYPATADLVEHSQGTYSFPLPEPVKKAEIDILGFNFQPDSPAYDLGLGLRESKSFDKPVSQVPVSLARLQPGKYQLKVNKETRMIYYDPHLGLGDRVGVIEIFNHLPASHDYALLTGEEKIKQVNYSLVFPARRVLWKYIRKDSKAQTITDTGATGYEFKLTGDDFVSVSPIPLSEGVLSTLKLEFNTADFKLSPLPNPPVYYFGKCVQDDFEYLCSVMYLNY
jgi:hypothetical protein